MNSYFARTGEHRFQPSELTGGAWATDEQHIAPMTGLITHEVDRLVEARGGDGLATARISMDILGVLKLEEFELTVEVVRPGRTIELLEAVVVARGRPAVRARVWRMAGADTSAVAGGLPEPLPDPATLPAYEMSDVWPGGYITSIETRPAGEVRPGRGAVWVGSSATLVRDEPASPLAEWVKLVDTANGIVVRESPKEWMFPNLDLTIHLYRQPSGSWTGLDTTVTFGPDGHGLTSTALHDVHGPVGRAEQILTVRPL
ncbi:thioesterase family protein [Winogradskya humida]|uniref:Thioesterase n=1 Tax=Winogradskya humida TaxID=113566 RepID=A0ABQ3ZZF7_9ACTN|nr:thioesterase family protein [Actinoplanes humidus]GIE23981.1 thioesterase [Actinoplanes humidus]